MIKLPEPQQQGSRLTLPTRRIALFILCLVVSALSGTGAQERRKSDAPNLFPVKQDGKWGYIDRTGKMVVAPQYDVAWEFREGLAYVKAGAQRGLIDRNGKLVVNLQQVDLAGLFSEGLAPVQTASQPPRFGFIDRTGKLVINPQYDAARGFEEGLALVMVERKYGFIDKRGRMVVKPQFDKAASFSEGLAAVVVDNKHGYIDRTGKLVIAPQYNNAYNFAEGLAAVAIGGRYACINRKGEVLIEPQAGYVGA
ncbi:MAG TPA: WG repeat-containing protein, partial [Pyrinomonadaceae bacterium]